MDYLPYLSDLEYILYVFLTVRISILAHSFFSKILD